MVEEFHRTVCMQYDLQENLWLLQENLNKVKNGDVKVDSINGSLLNFDGVMGNFWYMNDEAEKVEMEEK
jgi:hypothetical protein